MQQGETQLSAVQLDKKKLEEEVNDKIWSKFDGNSSQKPEKVKKEKKEKTFEGNQKYHIDGELIKKADDLLEKINIVNLYNADGEILHIQDELDRTYKILFADDLQKRIDKELLYEGYVIDDKWTKQLSKVLMTKSLANKVPYDDVKNNILVNNGVIKIDDENIDFVSGNTDSEICLKRINLDYHKDLYKQKNDVVENFFNDIMCQDQELVSYLWHILATPFVSRNKYEKAFVFYGETGANGKTVLAATMKKVYGKINVTHVELGEMTSWNLALMDRGFVNWVQDMEKYKNWANFKKIVTGESLVMDVKFKDPVEKEVSTQLFINSNILPSLGAIRDGGFTRRLEYIPFNNTFEGDKKDPLIFKKIGTTENLEWILSKLMNMVEDLQNDLIGSWFKDNKPKEVTKLFETQQLEDSSALSFIDWLQYNIEWNENDNIYRLKNGILPTIENRQLGKYYIKRKQSLLWPKNLYATYSAYCEEDGYKRLQKKNFETHIKENKDISINRERVSESKYTIQIPNEGFMKIYKGE